jgi:hypothetical protein
VDDYVTYKLVISPISFSTQTIIETPEKSADFVIPYGRRDFSVAVDVFAVNQQEIVSERNYTATVILWPGLPPEDSNTNKG